MGKQRNPNRDKAKEIYLKEKGKISPKRIAERLSVDPAMVRKWKYLDSWEEELNRPKRGAPKGNKNAVGNSGGAPKGNTNAETHGAYSAPRVERWTEEERRAVEEIPLDFDPLAERQLKILLAKQQDLERRISALSGAEHEGELFLDRVMTMDTDKGTTTMATKSSQFSRRMVLEGELNRVQGRIQKMLDSIRNRDEAAKRLELEKERLKFQRERAMGAFNFPDGDEPGEDSEGELELEDDLEIVEE